MTDLPIIDVSPLFGDGTARAIDEAIGNALSRAGGFVITGFPGADVLEARARLLLGFFELPEAAKVAAGTFPTNPEATAVYRGFTSLLDSDDFARTEWFDIGSEETRVAIPVQGTEILAEQNLWPDTEPYEGWRREMSQHYLDLQTTAMAVMLSAGRAQGVDPRTLKDGFGSGNSTLRLLNYPAPEQQKMSGGELSLAAERHTDGSGLSLLWQAGPGLQAEGPDGIWRDVPQLPGSISVHLGDVLEMMTGGAINATPHRVIDHGGARQSIGFFLEPSPDASMTGTDRLEDTYGWRLLERLRSYPSMKDLVPEPCTI